MERYKPANIVESHSDEENTQSRSSSESETDNPGTVEDLKKTQELEDEFEELSNKEEDPYKVIKDKFFKMVTNNNINEVRNLLQEYSPQILLSAINTEGQTPSDLALYFHNPENADSQYNYYKMFEIFLEYYLPLPSGAKEYDFLAKRNAIVNNKKDIVMLFDKAFSKLMDQVKEQAEKNKISVAKFSSDVQGKFALNESQTLTDEEHYWEVYFALRKLGSPALVDTLVDDNSLIRYLKKQVKDINNDEHIFIPDNICNFQNDKDKYDEGFPFEKFAKFICGSNEDILIIPILNNYHYCGVILRKDQTNNLIFLEYFNPTSDGNNSAEDKDNIDKLKASLVKFIEKIKLLELIESGTSYVDRELNLELTSFEVETIKKFYPSIATNITNASMKQQMNGSDCGFIVGQTLVEKALDLPVSIRNYTISPRSEYIIGLAKARSNFCKIYEEGTDKIIWEQYISRIATAIAQTAPYDIFLRECIRLVPKLDDQQFNNILSELKKIVEEIRVGTKTSADSVRSALYKALPLETYSIDIIKQFCDLLLQPYFPTGGHLIFGVNKKFTDYLPESTLGLTVNANDSIQNLSDYKIKDEEMQDKVKQKSGLLQPHTNDLKFTEEHVNTSAFYDEILMLKIWDRFIQQTMHLKYWISTEDNQINSLFNNNTLNIPASRNSVILVKADGSLYKRANPEMVKQKNAQQGVSSQFQGKEASSSKGKQQATQESTSVKPEKMEVECSDDPTQGAMTRGVNDPRRLQSVSICSLVNHRSNLIGGYNAVTDNLKLALEQILAWNKAHPKQIIISHIIQFPYHKSEVHWNLGTLELEFDSETKNLIRVSLKAYDPYGGGKINEGVKSEIQTLIQQILKTDITIDNIENKEHSKQQLDSTSCGVISAEDGKDILEGNRERLKQVYQPGAINLRLQHLNEVREPDFQKRQWEDRRYNDSCVRGEPTLADKEFIKVKLLKVIDALSERDKQLFYEAFSLLADICKNSKGKFIQDINQLRKKEQNNALSEQDKIKISRFSGQEVYCKGQLDVIIADPTASAFKNLKTLFINHREIFKTIIVGNTNLFDVFFESTDYKYIDGARTFFEEFANGLKDKLSLRITLQNINKAKLKPDQKLSIIYKIFSYPGFASVLLLLDHDSFSIIEHGGIKVTSYDEEHLSFLRERLINEFLSETSNSLKNYVDNSVIQMIIKCLLETEILKQDNYYQFSISGNVIQSLSGAISKYNKAMVIEQSNRLSEILVSFKENILHLKAEKIRDILLELEDDIFSKEYTSKIEELIELLYIRLCEPNSLFAINVDEEDEVPFYSRELLSVDNQNLHTFLLVFILRAIPFLKEELLDKLYYFCLRKLKEKIKELGSDASVKQKAIEAMLHIAYYSDKFKPLLFETFNHELKNSFNSWCKLISRVYIFTSEEQRVLLLKEWINLLDTRGYDRSWQKSMVFSIKTLFKNVSVEEQSNILIRFLEPLKNHNNFYVRQALVEILSEIEGFSKEIELILALLLEDPHSEVRRFVHNTKYYNAHQHIKEEEFESQREKITVELIENKPKKSKKLNNNNSSNIPNEVEELKRFEKKWIDKNELRKGLSSENILIANYCLRKLYEIYFKQNNIDEKKKFINILFLAIRKKMIHIADYELTSFVYWKLLPDISLTADLVQQLLSYVQFDISHYDREKQEWINLLFGFRQRSLPDELTDKILSAFSSIIENPKSHQDLKSYLLAILGSYHKTEKHIKLILTILIKAFNGNYGKNFSSEAAELFDWFLEDRIVSKFAVDSFQDLNVNSDNQNAIEKILCFLMSIVSREGASPLGASAICQIKNMVQKSSHFGFLIFVQETIEAYDLEQLTEFASILECIQSKFNDIFNNRHAESLPALAWKYFYQKDYAQSLKLINKIKEKSLSLNLIYLKALNFYQLNEKDFALSCISQYLGEVYDAKCAIYLKAKILEDKQEIGLAIEAYNDALQFNPYYLQPLIGLYQLHFQIEDYLEADQFLDKIKDIHPRFTEFTPKKITKDVQSSMGTPLLEHINQLTFQLKKCVNACVKIAQNSTISDSDKEFQVKENFSAFRFILESIFGKSVVTNFKLIDEVPWEKLVKYPNQIARTFRDILMGLIQHNIPRIYHQNYLVYLETTNAQQELTQQVKDSHISSYLDNPLDFLKKNAHVFTAADFMQKFAFTDKLKGGYALGLSGDISSAYNILLGIFHLHHWMISYDEVGVEASGSTQNTQLFLEKIIKKRKPIVMFVPVIVDTGTHNITLDEIKYLIKYLQTEGVQNSFYFVFDAYNYLPLFALKNSIFLHHDSSLNKTPEKSPASSLNSVLDYLSKQFNSTPQAIFQIKEHMLLTRICVNLLSNVVEPIDQYQQKCLIIKEMFEKKVTYSEVLNELISRLNEREITKTEENLITIKLLDSLLLNEIIWFGSAYQPSKSDLFLLENLKKKIEQLEDQYQEKFLKTTNFLIKDFGDTLSSFKKDFVKWFRLIEKGIQWSGISDSSLEKQLTKKLFSGNSKATFFNLPPDRFVSNHKVTNSKSMK